MRQTFLVLFVLLLPLVGHGAERPHVLMISIDGMRPDYTTQAAEHDLKMPVLQKFIADGTYADGVTGVWPTVTFPSHTTLVTGVPPAVHGIVNNTLFDPLNEHPGVWYWYAKEDKAETLWQAAKEAGLTTASVNWPVTVGSASIDYNIASYAERENGKKHAVAADYPAGLVEDLSRAIPDLRNGGDGRRTQLAIAIINRYKPDFMTVHLEKTDEVQHAHGPFSPEANEAMETADSQIGQMMQAELGIDPNATIIVVSDHGFVATHTKVNLGALFVAKGLITIQPGDKGSKKPRVISWIAEPWLSGGSAAIVLHDPENKADYDRVLKVLEEAKANPALGIRQIVTHDTIVAHGGNPQANFFVDFKAGFRTGDDYKVDNLDDPNLTESTPGTGVHGYLPNTEPQVRSSFFAYGTEIKKGDDLGIIDMRQIAPTVAKLLGAKLPEAKMPPLSITK